VTVGVGELRVGSVVLVATFWNANCANELIQVGDGARFQEILSGLGFRSSG